MIWRIISGGVAIDGIEKNREMTGDLGRSRIWKEIQDFIITEYDEGAIRLQTFLKVINKTAIDYQWGDDQPLLRNHGQGCFWP